MKKQSAESAQNEALKVGFDLDGVLLYNPARIARPIIVFVKKIFFKKDLRKFHYPNTKFKKIVWYFLHRSSLFIAPGVEDIKKLVQEGKIKAYIISARYEFLKGDFQSWLNKIEADKYFSGVFYNNNDEQPYIFKQKIVQKLELDIFVEDNWDIVEYLNSQPTKKGPTVFWIFNILDFGISYPHRFPTLKRAVEKIKSLT